MSKDIQYPLNFYLASVPGASKDTVLLKDAEKAVDSLMDQYNSNGIKICKMHFKDGLSISEIARNTKKSEENVRKLIEEGEEIIWKNKILLTDGIEYQLVEIKKFKEKLLKELGGKVPTIND